MRHLSILLLILLGACGREPLRETPSPLVGSWNARLQPLSPAGSLGRHLGFRADGTFIATASSSGVYPGQTANQESSRSTTFGRYEVRGDRLVFRPDSLRTWDRMTGTLVQKPYPYTGFYDDATFEIEGRELRLSYTTYPADAPVATRQTFFRDLPD